MKINFNPPPSSPDEINGLKVNYAPTQRPFSKWRFKLVLILFISPFLAYILHEAYNFIIITEPGFILLKEIKVQTPVEGQIKYIETNSHQVKKGDVLAVLENKFLYEEYKIYLKKLKINEKDTNENIKNNRTALQMAKIFYNNQLEQYEKIKIMRKKGIAKELEVSNAMVQLEAAKLAYTNAKNTLENSKLALKDIYSDKVRMKELKTKLDALVIVSPANGTIGEVLGTKGEFLSKNDVLLNIEAHNSATFRVFLDPENAKYANLGQVVTVSFPTGIKMQGVISKINMKAVKTPSALKGPFARNNFSIVLEIKLEEEVPPSLMINFLPIKVRFSLF